MLHSFPTRRSSDLPALRCTLDTFGHEQLLFGSDYPHVPGGIDRFVTVLNSIGLTEKELVAIGSENAARLLGIDP
jgi:predicted TIM-barrel fold metal-dependent hydrolase